MTNPNLAASGSDQATQVTLNRGTNYADVSTLKDIVYHNKNIARLKLPELRALVVILFKVIENQKKYQSKTSVTVNSLLKKVVDKEEIVQSEFEESFNTTKLEAEVELCKIFDTTACNTMT